MHCVCVCVGGGGEGAEGGGVGDGGWWVCVGVCARALVHTNMLFYFYEHCQWNTARLHDEERCPSGGFIIRLTHTLSLFV